MRFTAVFIIALIGCSMASSFSNPADKVLNRVDSLVSAARTEQAQQSRLYASQAARCKAERIFRNKEIADGSVASGAAAEQLSICKSEVPVAVASKKQSVAELAASRAQLEAVNAEHEIFVSVNSARQAEHAEVLDSISGAYNIIGNFANGKQAVSNQAVFVEVSQKINKVFKLAIKHKFHKQMIPVMSALVQLTSSHATTVSSAALQKVVDLLRQLEANVRQSEVDRANEYTAYEKQYSNQVELLNTSISALGQIIKAYRAYIAALRRCVASEGKILASANAKVARNSKILAATVSMCNAYDLKFKQQTKQRTDYVNLLGSLRSFVVSSIASFKSGLYSRGDYTNTH